MLMSLSSVLGVSAILFGLGIAGIVISRKNIITLLMSVELILLAVNTNFIAFSYYEKDIAGQIFVFFILAIAAAEAAIGLALLMVLYRKQKNIEITSMNRLEG